MIILIDKYFPIVIFKINSYYEIDYKLLIKNLEHVHKNAVEKDQFINLYIDLFNLDDYEFSALTNTLSYLSDQTYTNISSVKIFLNKENTSYILKAAAYVNNNISPIKIEIIEIEKENKWNKMFRF